MVFVNRRVRDSHSVLLDQHFIVEAQLRHLIELGHEQIVCLNFDPAAAFHTYGFKWSAASIEWYVDQALVATAFPMQNEPWPTQPGRIMMNLWSGTKCATNWLGPFTYGGPESAEYDWVRYTP